MLWLHSKGGIATHSVRLPNGLHLIVEPVAEAPVVAVEVWVRAGTANETPATSGIAHLLEHLVFRGAVGMPPNALDETFEQAGGILDAFTERDWTRYCASVLPNRWQAPLQVLLRSLLSPALPAQALEQERQIILLDEYALHRADPIRKARYALFEQAFKGHPYSLPLLGDPEVVRRLDRAALHRFHATHYRPERMTVVVVGAVSPQEVRQVVEHAVRQSGATVREPAQPDSSPPLLPTLQQSQPTIVEQGECLAIGLPVPPTRELEGWAAAEWLRVVLAEPYRGLLYGGEPVPFGRLHSEYLPRLYGSLIALFALPPVEPVKEWQAQLQARLRAVLHQIAEGKARDALEQARTLVLTRHMATTRQLLERARWYGLCATLRLEPAPERYASVLDQLPVEYLEAFVAGLLGNTRQAPASAFGHIPATPTLARNGSGYPLHATRQRLANNLRVVAVSALSAEAVFLQVAVGHPPNADVAAGELTARMLFGATHNETERTLAARIARSGGTLQVRWAPAGALVSAVVRPDSVVSVLSLLKEALFRAEFSEPARQRALRHALYDRRYALTSCDGHMGVHLTGLYADSSALERTSLEAIRAYYRSYYRPENAVIVAVGAMRPETLTEYVRVVFGSAWERAVAQRTAEAPVAEYLCRRATAVAGVAYAGYVWEMPVAQATDYYALLAWQAVLGEGKRARLFVHAREYRGRGYTVCVATELRRGSAVGWAGVQAGDINGAAAGAAEVFTSPVLPAELERAKALLQGEWARLHLDFAALSAALAWAELSGLGYESVLNAPDYLRTLTPEIVDRYRERLWQASSVQLR
ncbi:MAG: insulinase family protein [Fimbriimonadales bacterium]|nr:insulinase family protein [Fimbriimonadales bacterium]MDW8051164.1 insulinase family protein [Armatimonadota bacterium]